LLERGPSMDKAEESSTGNPRRFNGSTEQAHLPPQVASLIANRSTNHYQTAMEMGIGINPQIARLPKTQTNRSTRLSGSDYGDRHSADAGRTDLLNHPHTNSVLLIQTNRSIANTNKQSGSSTCKEPNLAAD